MLDRLLYADWNEAPDAMAFEVSLAEAVEGLAERLARVLPRVEEALAHPAAMPASYWEDCLDLYLRAPALVNITLNHKICVEQGLPLHPTQYFEVSDKTRHALSYPAPQAEAAQAFFLSAISAARAVVALDPAGPSILRAFAAETPEAVRPFVYTSTPDKYTWRASDPRKVRALAEDVQAKLRPRAVVGAAHGSIMAGLLFANLLEAPLYFIRFSLFKRKDTAPVIGASDLRFLAAYREGPVLLFDEDVAKGTTLDRFTTFLQPFFDASRSAGVLCHRHADFRPDFVGRMWSD